MDDKQKEDAKDLLQEQGSLFIANNTSYAGCDIRVVFNVYDGGKALKELTETYYKEIEKLISQQDQYISNIFKYKIKLAEVKAGVSESREYQRILNKSISESDRIGHSITSLQKRIEEIEKNQPTASTKTLATVQTLSLSTHRDKSAVRSLGTVYPKSFTRGPREIAGSIIFTVFNEHVLYEFLEAHETDFDGNNFSSVLLDQLPPVDITISYANEYGSISRSHIYGIEFMNEGSTLSIEDILTENVVQFVARDYDPMRAVSQRKIDEQSQIMLENQAITASNLLFEEDFLAVKDMLNPFQRFTKRRNPFL